MNEIIQSWPWFDRAIAGFFIFAVISIPFGIGALSKKLDRIIELLGRTER